MSRIGTKLPSPRRTKAGPHEPTDREPLSRDRVLHTAVRVADRDGLAGLTIRALAQELGVKPMSVYYYVANKEEILDGIVDIVFAEIDLPAVGQDWRSEMRRRARSARRVLGRHRWAIGLLESRTRPGPATLRHHDTVLGVLRAAGFSRGMTAHAYALIDSYTYGFALQEAGLPFDGPDTVDQVAQPIMDQLTAGNYPTMVDMTVNYYLQSGYDFADEFEFGLDLILNNLHTRRPRSE